MKIFTYWETAPNRKVPPYVLLGISSMRRIFGEDLELLTPRRLGELGLETEKEWGFRKEWDEKIKPIRSIVAKSDYLRLAVVAKFGGFWLDADTVVLDDFRRPLIERFEYSSRVWWDTEAFFGARAKNNLLIDSADNMLAAKYQTWGNPGGIKDAISQNGNLVDKIPFDFSDPGIRPVYSFKNSDLMLENWRLDEFLLNRQQHILKLYNTSFSKTMYGAMDPIEFLRQPVLLARVFRSVEPSLDWWSETVSDVEDELNRTR